MKYLFDMGEVWHLYSDVGNQWIYHRLEQVSEEILDKSGDSLPGPLGKLDILKKLEQKCAQLEVQAKAERAQLEVQTKAERARLEAQIKAERAQYTAEIEQLQKKQEQSEEHYSAEIERMQSEAAQGQKMYAESLEQQRLSFEKSYEEIRKLAEDLQKEGKVWRQRYLDLAYQMTPKKE